MARFKVRRIAVTLDTSHPWKVADAERPFFIGSYLTHDAAIRAVSARIETERNRPVPIARVVAERLGGDA